MSELTEILSWLAIGLVICLISLSILKDREKKREAQQMDNLTKMNRGNMDKPGWVKQPWQHEPRSEKRVGLISKGKDHDHP
ncbi:hypothetical protein [Pseudomonas sp. PS02302]|uniref:hypothetical protein n=1 Tax=Pseudomonas sp. PS02302 TaxID=2991428 RepID=UPI00249B5E41|nr:hypothetical protein [Pseudomonas sp. PS02302]